MGSWTSGHCLDEEQHPVVLPDVLGFAMTAAPERPRLLKLTALAVKQGDGAAAAQPHA